MVTLWAAAAAAAAMYFFDPQSGRRRRALVRDKLAWLRDEAGDVREAAEGRAEDLRNRATGVMHETRAAAGNLAGGGEPVERQDAPTQIRPSASPNPANTAHTPNTPNAAHAANAASDRAA